MLRATKPQRGDDGATPCTRSVFALFSYRLQTGAGCFFVFKSSLHFNGRNTSSGRRQRYPHQRQIAQKFAQREKTEALQPIQPQPAGGKRQRVAQ